MVEERRTARREWADERRLLLDALQSAEQERDEARQRAADAELRVCGLHGRVKGVVSTPMGGELR